MKVLATRVGYRSEDVWEHVADSYADLVNVEPVLGLGQCRNCGSGGNLADARPGVFDPDTVLYEEDGQVNTGYRLHTFDDTRFNPPRKRTVVVCGWCGTRSGVHLRDEALVTF